MSLEIINSTIHRAATPIKEKNRKKLKNVYTISFDDKTIKKLNLSRILQDPLA